MKPEIVPRWEWRTFGDGFPDVEARLGPAENVRESVELYLLGAGSDSSVKVRGGQMDVKRLERVSDEGLEQWRPVLKADVPLTADDARVVLEALGVTTPALERREYSVDELVGTHDLHAVEVHKRRAHYTFEGCMTELSEIGTDRGSRRTIAVESEDPARVLAAVRELGFEPRWNVN